LFQKTGNVSDLPGSFLDEQINRLDNPEEGLAVLNSFVPVKGTKRQMNPEEVMDFAHTLYKSMEKPVLNELLQTFIHLRILSDKDKKPVSVLKKKCKKTDRKTILPKMDRETRNCRIFY
jgi:hypothetical protein